MGFEPFEFTNPYLRKQNHTPKSGILSDGWQYRSKKVPMVQRSLTLLLYMFKYVFQPVLILCSTPVQVSKHRPSWAKFSQIFLNFSQLFSTFLNFSQLFSTFINLTQPFQLVKLLLTFFNCSTFFNFFHFFIFFQLFSVFLNFYHIFQLFSTFSAFFKFFNFFSTLLNCF